MIMDTKNDTTKPERDEQPADSALTAAAGYAANPCKEGVERRAASSRSHAPAGSLPNQFKGPFYGHGMGKIFIKTKCGDTPVIDIRGWGYLTGGGALNMSEVDAVKVQDQFEQWVIDALNAQAENTESRRRRQTTND